MKKFYYGGQAVVEGVMMRGRKTMVTAVRRPDGSLAAETQPLPPLYSGWLRQTPLIRGIIVLIESMTLGIKALMYSTNVSLEEEGEKVSGGMAGIMMAFSLALAVGLFSILPLFLTRLFQFESSIVFNLVEGVIRVTIFLVYLRVMSLVPDIKRVFAYHGAEHKTVNAYEAGASLDIDSVKKYSTAHTRCGTSFLFIVMIVSIIVFSLTGLHGIWLMVLSRIVLIPLIASLSYEFIYFGARHSHNPVIKALLTPGLWLQSFTTREPDDAQIEVGILAMQKVIETEKEEENLPAEPLPAA
ncbi:MAG: DUF1385 domain-containing protein [Dehalococcoidales bacterium]|nr:DUF1385 domain-containing protein [Dehalococcoidales bacterium]